MAYTSINGRRGNEHASRTAQSKIINSPEVQKFLSKINLPKDPTGLSKIELGAKSISKENMFDYIIAIDGGYREISVKKDFPSSSLALFQFGAVLLKKQDLENIQHLEFISPELMSDINNSDRYHFVLPIQNMSYDGSNLELGFRKALFDLFKQKASDFSLIDDLYWLTFHQYKSKSERKPEDLFFTLSNCPNPNCTNKNIEIHAAEMVKDYKTKCPECHQTIFLTDIFRLFEIVTDEQGASGVMGYVTNVLEQFLLISVIRDVSRKPSLLDKTLFIKDGPLGFFGQTANMYKLFREMINYMQAHKKTINMCGVEKSGAFAEHAHLIDNQLGNHEVIFLSNKYINTYIKPTTEINKEYAPSSYYSGKMIFKATKGYIYVVSIPSKSKFYYTNGDKSQLIGNVDKILSTLSLLRSDSYDDALLPITVINKAVSISQSPSASILEKMIKHKLN